MRMTGTTGMMEFLLAKVAQENSRRGRIVAMLDHVCRRWAGDVLVLGGEASMPARLNGPARVWVRLVHLEPTLSKRYSLCVAGSAHVNGMQKIGEYPHETRVHTNDRPLARVQHIIDGPIVIFSSPNIVETVSVDLPPWWGEPVRVEEWNETWFLRRLP